MSEKIQYKSTVVEQEVPYIKESYCDKCKKVIKRTIFNKFKDETEDEDTKGLIRWYKVIYGDYGDEEPTHLDICINCIDNIFAEFSNHTKTHKINSAHIYVQHCWEFKGELK